MQFKTSAPITGRMLPLTSSLISNEVIMGSAVSTVSKSPAHPAQVTIRLLNHRQRSISLHLPQPKVLGTAMGNSADNC